MNQNNQNKSYSKWKSRTFLFAIVWNVGLLAAIILFPAAPWLGNMVTFAGTITLGYIGKRAVQDGTNNWKNNKGGLR